MCRQTINAGSGSPSLCGSISPVQLFNVYATPRHVPVNVASHDADHVINQSD